MVNYTDHIVYQKKNAKNVKVELPNNRGKDIAINNDKEITSNFDFDRMQKGEVNMSDDVMGKKARFRRLPRTIRELLKQLIERRVTIVLDAEIEPEKVEIEAVCGNLLVAETENHHIKFVDIRCICEVIVSREELLEGIFAECNEEENELEHEHFE